MAGGCWRIRSSRGGNCDSRKKGPIPLRLRRSLASSSVPRRVFTTVKACTHSGQASKQSKQVRQAGRQAGGQATWYALAAESERSEVTIDANLSECHVSAAAETQYTHAMDDNGTASRSTIPLNPCLLHPYILYIYATSDGTEPASAHWWWVHLENFGSTRLYAVSKHGVFNQKYEKEENGGDSIYVRPMTYF